MAQPTAQHAAPLTNQHPTPGVGVSRATQMHDAPPGVAVGGVVSVSPNVPPPEPELFETIDPVLLMRLYPGAKDPRAAALAAGKAAFEASGKVVASQQEPVAAAAA